MAVQSSSRRESLSSLYKFDRPPPPPPPTAPPPPPDPLDVASPYVTASQPPSNRYLLANSKSSSNLYYVGGVNQLNNNVILPAAPSSTLPFSADQVLSWEAKLEPFSGEMQAGSEHCFANKRSFQVGLLRHCRHFTWISIRNTAAPPCRSNVINTRKYASYARYILESRAKRLIFY